MRDAFKLNVRLVEIIHSADGTGLCSVVDCLVIPNP